MDEEEPQVNHLNIPKTTKDDPDSTNLETRSANTPT